MRINTAKELEVYKKAYELAMRIFEISKRFPPEEKFALTGQIRRSSRSVCTNLREAWAKRRYEAHFVSKLTDSDGENNKPTLHSISPKTAVTLPPGSTRHSQGSTAKQAMLGSMINRPTPFLISAV